MRQALRNLDIGVEEWPGREALGLLEEEGTLFGLYTGVPLPDRDGAEPTLPDRITIYRQPILRSCSTRVQVEREIRITLWHEIGHYLGMTEEDLHRLGYS
jgi:predicted Zn-dependent protease with MMP-like domain